MLRRLRDGRLHGGRHRGCRQCGIRTGRVDNFDDAELVVIILAIRGAPRVRSFKRTASETAGRHYPFGPFEEFSPRAKGI